MPEIEVNLPVDVISCLAIQAHEKDITLNDHIVNILTKYVQDHEVDEANTAVIDEDGVVSLPDDIINKLQWDEHTFLNCYISGNSIVLQEKTDWTVEDAQENFDDILERVTKTKNPHHILHKGKTYVVVPYFDKLKEFLD